MDEKKTITVQAVINAPVEEVGNSTQNQSMSRNGTMLQMIGTLQGLKMI